MYYKYNLPEAVNEKGKKGTSSVLYKPSSNTNLYDIARSLIPSEDMEFEIGHVRGLLILSLIKFGRRDWTAAWVLVGHATRISLYLGLDQRSSDKPQPMSTPSNILS